jgi:DNA-binding transcriptional MerR regulator
MEISIGELSSRTGVKVPTIRYYESVALMPAPLRSEGKQRRYSEAEVSRLTFIRHARELGFELAAIRELLAMSAHPDQSCVEADGIARRHMSEVDRRIGQLTALRAELQRMVDACGRGRVGDCHVIETLANHDRCKSEHH